MKKGLIGSGGLSQFRLVTPGDTVANGQVGVAAATAVTLGVTRRAAEGSGLHDKGGSGSHHIIMIAQTQCPAPASDQQLLQATLSERLVRADRDPVTPAKDLVDGNPVGRELG